MKPLTSISLDIKGRSWCFKLFTDRAFNKLHNPDDEGNAAMTIPGTREVHFRKSDFSGIAIKHEIGHILHFSTLSSSSELTADQTVEIMCELIGEHAEEIILWASQVIERFLNH